MSISETIFCWFFRFAIAMLAAHGLMQFLQTPDPVNNAVRFAFSAIGIAIIELILDA